MRTQPNPQQAPGTAAAPAAVARRRLPVQVDAPVPGTCSESEAFALQVRDESMAPEFPAGCIVVVDPGLAPADGQFVIADGRDGTVLRRLEAHAGGWWLRTLDGERPAEAVAVSAVRGVVTQRAGRRRRDHRHYPYPDGRP